MAKFKYKAFISYSHDDETWAKWLHRKLESYRVPKRLVQSLALDSNRLVPVFRDREDLATSSSLSDEIQAALDDSEYLIVLCSPAAAASKWVNEEIRQFKKLGRPVFLVIVAGEPEKCFPPAVRFEVDASGNITDKPVEPLAADLRKSSDGKTLGKLKLVAGLLGTDLDELRQRESQARQKRLILISIASLMGMAAAIMLATFAIISQRQAEKALEEAERQRSIVEAVNQFYNVDLLEAASPEREGRDVTVFRVLELATEKVDGQFDDRPEIEAAVRMSLALTWSSLGEYEIALDQFGQSADLLTGIHGDYHADVIEALSALGVGLADVSRFDEAEETFLDALRKANMALDEEHKATLSLKNNLAVFYVHQMRSAEALEIYLEIIEPMKRVYGENHSWTLRTQRNMAAAYRELGNVDKAIEITHEAIATMEKTLSASHPDLLDAKWNLAAALYSDGRPEKAIELASAVLDGQKESLGALHPSTLFTYQNIGAMYAGKGNDSAKASEILTEVITKYREIEMSESFALILAMSELAWAYGDLNQVEEADAAYTEVLKLSQKVLGSDHYDTLLIISNYARFYNAIERFEDALKLTLDTIESGRDALADYPFLSGMLHLGAGVAYLNLGHHEDAETELLDAQRQLNQLEGREEHKEKVRQNLEKLYELWQKPEES